MPFYPCIKPIHEWYKPSEAPIERCHHCNTERTKSPDCSDVPNSLVRVYQYRHVHESGPTEWEWGDEPKSQYEDLEHKSRVLRQESLEALDHEVYRARLKFPGNRYLVTALMEEVGELAQAYLQKKDVKEVMREALQVACVAMRIFEEGDPVYNSLTEQESKGAPSSNA